MMRFFKLECRMSLLVMALFLSLSGVAMAESTHESSECGHRPDCILTVFKSFVAAVQQQGGINFSVGH